MSGRAGVVLAEMKSGTLLVGGIVALFLAVLLPSLTRSDALSWSDRSTLTALVSVFTAPVIAAATCLQVSRRMAGMGDPAEASASGRGFVARVGWLAGSLWATATALVQILSSIAFGLPTDQRFTAPMALPWLLCVVVLLAAVSVGAVVGSKSRGYGWAAVLALMIFAWLYGTTFLSGRWSILSPLDNGTVFAPYQEPAVDLLVLHITVSVAVILGAAAVVARPLGARFAAADVAAVLAVGCVVAGAGMDPSRVRNQPLTQDPVCDRSSGIELCVWPMMAASLQPQLDQLVIVKDIVDGRWSVDDAFAQEGLPDTVEGARLYISDEPSLESDMIAAVLAVLPTCAATPVGEDALSNIQSWLFSRVDSGWAPGSEPAEVAQRPAGEQTRWIQGQLSAGDCQ